MRKIVAALVMGGLCVGLGASCSDDGKDEDNSAANNSVNNSANNDNSTNNTNGTPDGKPTCPTVPDETVLWNAPAEQSEHVRLSIVVPKDFNYSSQNACLGCSHFSYPFLDRTVRRNPERDLTIFTIHDYFPNRDYEAPTQELPLATDANRNGSEYTEIGRLEFDGKTFPIVRTPTDDTSLQLKAALDYKGKLYQLEVRTDVRKLGAILDTEYKHCIKDFERIALATIKSVKFVD